ncbi:MAG: hypothetical protein RI907_2183 [Pseudomonadota bacterium]|jgi:hypothetical protein
MHLNLHLRLRFHLADPANRRPAAWLLGAAWLAASAMPAAAHACCRFGGSGEPTLTQLRTLPVQGRELGQAKAGQGPHAWRFVVRDPVHPERPWRGGAYQIGLRTGLTWEGGPIVHNGVTDAQGRTDIVRTRQPFQPEDWVVIPGHGHGRLSQSFRLTGPDETGLAGVPYMVEIKGGTFHCGTSLAGGHTMRIWTERVTTLVLHDHIDPARCQRLSAAVTPVLAQARPADRIAGLRRLLAQPRLAESRTELARKLGEQLVAWGSEADIRAHAQALIAEPGLSRAEQSARLNSLGWSLLEPQPPRWLALAEALLAQGRERDPSAAILDSHGWALHLLGRHEEALAAIEASLSAFRQTCTSDEDGMVRETLDHQRAVLLALGRPAPAAESADHSCALLRDAAFVAPPPAPAASAP